MLEDFVIKLCNIIYGFDHSVWFTAWGIAALWSTLLLFLTALHMKWSRKKHRMTVGVIDVR